MASLAALVLLAVGLRVLSRLAASVDLHLVRDAVRARSPALTTVAHGASWLGRSGVLVPVAVIIALAASARGRPAAWMLVAGIVGAVVLQNVAKALIDRPRPPVHRLEQVSGTSFPSGHATEATAFFVLLAVWGLRSRRSGPVRRRIALLAGLAAAVVIAAVGTSRVYLGVHYPTDVAAGIVLGAGWATVVAATFRPAAS